MLYHLIYLYRVRTMNDFLCKPVQYSGSRKGWPRKRKSVDRYGGSRWYKEYKECTNELLLLDEEAVAEASPSIGNTLCRVSMMFAHPAITPPEVNRFGWNLGHSENIAGSCPWQFLGAICAEARAGERAEILFFFLLSNTWFPDFFNSQTGSWTVNKSKHYLTAEEN